MAKNIINMILWHPEMEIDGTKITYIHRGVQGNLKTIDGISIEKLEGGFLILKEGTHIPYHRIVKIEFDNKVLWKK
ncbi:MAG: RNA repair domain-containing protein [Methanobacterium paludis]|uniref:MJ1316 RNA cyclic group end recognition domain-containing protein n=1 Tax=Methanobacterium paludis (strain DSM 25820 / JCM 18151 / SWAN1) TaxID=868131 RepID=F6D2Y8_METPW|nr:RNA repair domain-containing protein [Methanobacterium paludis]AEG19117.1 protein of unknown function DUF504 [Methanobacterium paludis]MCE7697570.1 RNA repair domain-containing protein [Methanobacterium paludis]